MNGLESLLQRCINYKCGSATDTSIYAIMTIGFALSFHNNSLNKLGVLWMGQISKSADFYASRTRQRLLFFLLLASMLLIITATEQPSCSKSERFMANTMGRPKPPNPSLEVGSTKSGTLRPTDSDCRRSATLCCQGIWVLHWWRVQATTMKDYNKHFKRFVEIKKRPPLVSDIQPDWNQFVSPMQADKAFPIWSHGHEYLTFICRITLAPDSLMRYVNDMEQRYMCCEVTKRYRIVCSPDEAFRLNLEWPRWIEQKSQPATRDGLTELTARPLQSGQCVNKQEVEQFSRYPEHAKERKTRPENPRKYGKRPFVEELPHSQFNQPVRRLIIEPPLQWPDVPSNIELRPARSECMIWPSNVLTDGMSVGTSVSASMRLPANEVDALLDELKEPQEMNPEDWDVESGSINSNSDVWAQEAIPVIPMTHLRLYASTRSQDGLPQSFLASETRRSDELQVSDIQWDTIHRQAPGLRLTSCVSAMPSSPYLSLDSIRMSLTAWNEYAYAQPLPQLRYPGHKKK